MQDVDRVDHFRAPRTAESLTEGEHLLVACLIDPLVLFHEQLLEDLEVDGGAAEGGEA